MPRGVVWNPVPLNTLEDHHRPWVDRMHAVFRAVSNLDDVIGYFSAPQVLQEVVGLDLEVAMLMVDIEMEQGWENNMGLHYLHRNGSILQGALARYIRRIERLLLAFEGWPTPN